jgi:hypothetical protein
LTPVPLNASGAKINDKNEVSQKWKNNLERYYFIPADYDVVRTGRTVRELA